MIQQSHSWAYIQTKLQLKRYMHPMFIAALFIIAKTWKQPKCPLTNEWIRKTWYISTTEYYSATTKNEIMPFAATWIQLEMIIVSEVRKRKTNTMVSLICGIRNMTQMNLFMKQTESQTRRIDWWLQGGGGLGRDGVRGWG